MPSALDDLFAPYGDHLSVVELATILGVTQKTAYDYLQKNEIPHYRIGTRWLILRDDVREFLQNSARSAVR